MFQTRDIKNSETSATSDQTENMCHSEERDGCRVKEGNTDQTENSPQTRTGTPADDADIAETKVKNSIIQTEDIEQEETLAGRGALIEPAKEGPRAEKNMTNTWPIDNCQDCWDSDVTKVCS